MGELQRQIPKPFVVSVGHIQLARQKLLNPFQLRASHSCLQIGHPVIPAPVLMPEPLICAKSLGCDFPAHICNIHAVGSGIAIHQNRYEAITQHRFQTTDDGKRRQDHFPTGRNIQSGQRQLILKGKWQSEALLERCSSQRGCMRKPYRITELQRPRGVVPRCQSPLRDYMIMKS